MEWRFEFDENKSRGNQAKHEIDFVQAQAMWLDDQLIEIPARVDDEPRSLVVARIGGVYWSAVITRRGTAIRLISVRRARSEEVRLHER